MVALILDGGVEERLREERRASGADRYDEVWEGVYVMSPLANNEHQEIVSRLVAVFQIVLGLGERGEALAGVNVSDREDDWEHNYRIPDVAVFLRGTSARNRGTHWLGGPDFAVEVASKGDGTRDKLPFYAAVGTRELLLIDRGQDPWALELHRPGPGGLECVGASRPGEGEALRGGVLPLTFRLVPGGGGGRPLVEVAEVEGEGRWRI